VLCVLHTSQTGRHATRSRFRDICLIAMVSCCTVSILTDGTVTQRSVADETVALCRRKHRLPFALRSHRCTKSDETLPSDERL
jgi:hypothetical protein